MAAVSPSPSPSSGFSCGLIVACRANITITSIIVRYHRYHRYRPCYHRRYRRYLSCSRFDIESIAHAFLQARNACVSRILKGFQSLDAGQAVLPRASQSWTVSSSKPTDQLASIAPPGSGKTSAAPLQLLGLLEHLRPYPAAIVNSGFRRPSLKQPLADCAF